MFGARDKLLRMSGINSVRNWTALGGGGGGGGYQWYRVQGLNGCTLAGVALDVFIYVTGSPHDYLPLAGFWDCRGGILD